MTPPTYAITEPLLLGAGYEPIPISLPHPTDKAAGKRPPSGCVAWQEPTVASRAEWLRRFSNCGTGLLTRHNPACDIDFTDETIGDELEALARQMLGNTPIRRIGLAPKRLLVYRTDTPFEKLMTPFVLPPNAGEKAKGQRIEILANGQQFVAYGIHPDTAKPYYYTDSTPLVVPSHELPTITHEMAQSYIEAASRLIETKLIPAGWTYKDEPKKERKAQSQARPASAKRERTNNVADAFEPIKQAALARLEAWVPALVPGAFRHGAGWRCVATWRGVENPNVGIHAHGIRDFGDDAGHSAIDLVMLANGLSFIEAVRALASRLGLELPERDAADPQHDPSAVPSPISPAPNPDAPTVDRVRELVAMAIGRFTDATLHYHDAVERFEIDIASREAGFEPAGNLSGFVAPVVPRHGISAVTGIGKSTIVRQSVVQRLRAALPDRQIIVAVPTHALAEEASEEARRAELQAATLRGRDADRPAGWTKMCPTDCGKMCLDPEAPEDALHSLEGIQETVCIRGRGLGAEFCEHFDMCPYQIQRVAAADADVVFVAHQQLFHEKPGFLSKPSAVVLDESFWQVGTNDKSTKILCDCLRRYRPIPGKSGDTDKLASQRLAYLNGLLADALESCTGPITRAALTTVGITAANAGEAKALWWRLKQDSGIVPGLPRKERKDRRGQVEQVNKEVARYAAVWNVVAGLLTGIEDCTAWLQCGTIPTDDAAEVPGALMNCRKEIKDGWQVPTLVLDATLRPELVRPYLPNLTVTAMEYPATPNAKVIQILGAPVAMSKLSEAESRDEKYRKTAKNHLTDLARYIEIKASRYRRCLVVAQMDVEASLKAIGLPANVEITHYNATRGIDRWRDVDYELAIGRTLPQPYAPEHKAEALTGRPVDRLGRWYPRHDGGSEYHPDPVAEAARWSVCEAEIVQTIGRARAINRTAGNPVLIEVMNDVALPVPVDETIRWQAPTVFDVLATRPVIVAEPWEAVASAHSDIFKSAEAAKQAWCRVTRDKRLYREFLIGVCHDLAPAEFRWDRVGKRAVTGLVLSRAGADVAGWLAEHLPGAKLVADGQGEAAAEPPAPLKTGDPAQSATPAEAPSCTTAVVNGITVWVTPDGRRWLRQPTADDMEARRPIIFDATEPARFEPSAMFKAGADIMLEPGLRFRPAHRMRLALNVLPALRVVGIADFTRLAAVRIAEFIAANTDDDGWPADLPSVVRSLFGIPFDAPSVALDTEPTGNLAACATEIPDIEPADIGRVSWIGSVAFIGGVEVGRIGKAGQFVPRSQYFADDSWWPMRRSAVRWCAWTPEAAASSNRWMMTALS